MRPVERVGISRSVVAALVLVAAVQAGVIAWMGHALGEAGLSVWDLSFAESHDCFTIAELIEYEAMGLTAPGEGKRAIMEGWVQADGKLPVENLMNGPASAITREGSPSESESAPASKNDELIAGGRR